MRFFHFLIVHNQCTTFNGIIYFSGMKTEGAHITRIENAFSVHFNAKSMSSIVNNLQSIFVCYFLKLALVSQGLPYTCTGSDSCCVRSNGHLYFVRVYVSRFGVNIYKYGFNAVPPKRVGSSDKTIRSCYHFTG